MIFRVRTGHSVKIESLKQYESELKIWRSISLAQKEMQRSDLAAHSDAISIFDSLNQAREEVDIIQGECVRRVSVLEEPDPMEGDPLEIKHIMCSLWNVTVGDLWLRLESVLPESLCYYKSLICYKRARTCYQARPIYLMAGNISFILGEELYEAAVRCRNNGKAEDAIASEEKAREFYMNAAREFRAVHAKMPTDRELLYRCCESWLHAEKWHRAMRYIEKLLSAMPNETYLLEYKGEFLLQRGRLNEAMVVSML